MKVTKKTVKHECETTQVVCEITQKEFDKICAETAASTVANIVDVDIDGLMVALSMTNLLAKFVVNLDKKLFNIKTENPDKKEEK